MSAAVSVEQVYSAIAESAGLLDVACARDKVWPLLTAYQDAFAEAVIVFSMATGERDTGELDYTITVPLGGADPYARALAGGFAAQTDHPVGALLSDVQARCPVRGYAIDCGVVGGFKKTYTFFPLDDLPGLAKLADIPSMPRGLAENAGTFADYGLADRVTMLGIDYRHHTMNAYFGRFPAGCLEPQTVRSMLREIGLADPSESMLEFLRKSFSIYITVGWDTPRIERICFAVITPDPIVLPAGVDPAIGRFATSAPYAYAGNRILVYGGTVAPGGEYYKLGSYYQLAAETRRLLVAFDAIADPA
jgi:Aromatic prenyltransferase Orf2